MARKRIAIVGSGISGIGALWALRDTRHEIHLFEAEDRLGGHTNTVLFKSKSGEVPVDTGFIVMNTATYPNLIAFLKQLRIDTVPTDMTFGVSRDEGSFEWSGTSPNAIFAQRSNLFRPSMWRMIFDIIRFNQSALDLLANEHSVPLDLTIGEYLDQQGYSSNFRDDYLIPMTASVWSTGPDKCALEFPAVTLVRFLWNHHLLNTIAARPTWLTIPGGSKQYIEAVLNGFPKDRIHLSTPVTNLRNDDDGSVILSFKGRKPERFDEVILACHGNQAFDIIKPSANTVEKDIMSSFQTTPNIAYLHSDLSLMPQRRLAWSAWNYMTTSQPASKPISSASGDLQKVCLTYNMNILQHIQTSTFGDILVTLNPLKAPAPSLTQATYQYQHPLYNPRAVEAQGRLKQIQGTRGVWYAGAWTGYGFHEDGFTSGLRVAVEGLGGQIPWKLVDSKYSRGEKPIRTSKNLVLRLILEGIQILIVLLLKVLGGDGSKSKKL